MKLARFLLACALLAAPVALAADEPASDDNAALQYWQAFGLMTDATKKMLENLDAVKFEGDVLSDVRDGNPRLEYLHAGAAKPRCDWGIDFRKGPETLLPHLAESRELARLAVLRARYRFENGRHRDGVDDVLATFELAKDVGETPVLICLVVRYHLENFAIDTLARDLAKMDRATLDHLAKALEPLPVKDSLSRVWSQESKYFVDWAIERVGKIEKDSAGDARKQKEGMWKLVSMLMDADDFEQLRAIGMPTPGKLRETLTSLKGLLAEMEEVTDLPPAEQDARLAEIQKPYQAEPLTKLFMPEQNKFFPKRRNWQARHALLDAAVAVAREGEKVLQDKRYADPFGDGAFVYRKTEKGFELQSKLVFEGKPVVLVVGK